MSAKNRTESDFEPVTFVVTKARLIKSKNIFAFVDVEMRIADVSFWIRGVQVRHLGKGGGSSVHLPTYKDVTGGWLPAVELPEELREPLADAVLEFLVDEGIARQRYAAAV